MTQLGPAAPLSISAIAVRGAAGVCRCHVAAIRASLGAGTRGLRQIDGARRLPDPVQALAVGSAACDAVAADRRRGAAAAKYAVRATVRARGQHGARSDGGACTLLDAALSAVANHDAERLARWANRVGTVRRILDIRRPVLSIGRVKNGSTFPSHHNGARGGVPPSAADGHERQENFGEPTRGQ